MWLLYPTRKMSTKLASSTDHADFATIFSFLENFGHHIGQEDVSYSSLQSFINGSRDHIEQYAKLHIKLLRGIGNSVNISNWERQLEKYCRDFPDGDDETLVKGGYKSLTPTARLRILNNLLDEQFEYNSRFNEKVNKPDDLNFLRQEPLGRDKFGRLYWYFLDDNLCLRVYREWRDVINEEYNWELVCQDEDELQEVIESLEREDPPKETFKGMRWKEQKETEQKLLGVKDFTIAIDKLDEELTEKLTKTSMKIEEIESYLNKTKAKWKSTHEKDSESDTQNVASGDHTDVDKESYTSEKDASEHSCKNHSDNSSETGLEANMDKNKADTKVKNVNLEENEMEVGEISDCESKSDSMSKSNSGTNLQAENERTENENNGKTSCSVSEGESNTSIDSQDMAEKKEKHENSDTEKIAKDFHPSGRETGQDEGHRIKDDLDKNKLKSYPTAATDDTSQVVKQTEVAENQTDSDSDSDQPVNEHNQIAGNENSSEAESGTDAKNTDKKSDDECSNVESCKKFPLEDTKRMSQEKHKSSSSSQSSGSVSDIESGQTKCTEKTVVRKKKLLKKKKSRKRTTSNSQSESGLDSDKQSKNGSDSSSSSSADTSKKSSDKSEAEVSDSDGKSENSILKDNEKENHLSGSESNSDQSKQASVTNCDKESNENGDPSSSENGLVSENHSDTNSSSENANNEKEISDEKDSSNLETTAHVKNNFAEMNSDSSQHSDSKASESKGDEIYLNGYGDNSPKRSVGLLARGSQFKSNGDNVGKEHSENKQPTEKKDILYNTDSKVFMCNDIIERKVSGLGNTMNGKDAGCELNTDLVKEEPPEPECEMKPLFEKFITSGALKQEIKKNLKDIKRDITQSIEKLQSALKSSKIKNRDHASISVKEKEVKSASSNCSEQLNKKGNNLTVDNSEIKNNIKVDRTQSDESAESSSSESNSSSSNSESSSESESENGKAPDDKSFKIIDQGEKITSEIDLIISDAIGEHKEDQSKTQAQAETNQSISLEGSDASSDSVVATKTELEISESSAEKIESFNSEIDCKKKDRNEVIVSRTSNAVIPETKSSKSELQKSEKLTDSVEVGKELLDWSVELNSDYSSDGIPDSPSLEPSANNKISINSKGTESSFKEPISINDSSSDNEPLSELKLKLLEKLKSNKLKETEKQKPKVYTEKEKQAFAATFRANSHKHLIENKAPMPASSKMLAKSALHKLLGSKPEPVKLVSMNSNQMVSISNVKNSDIMDAPAANKPAPNIPNFIIVNSTQKCVPVEGFKNTNPLYTTSLRSILSKPVAVVPKVVYVSPNSRTHNVNVDPECYITKFDVKKKQVSSIQSIPVNYNTKMNFNVQTVNGRQSMTGRQRKRKGGRQKLENIGDSSDESDASFDRMLKEAEADDSEHEDSDPEYDYDTLSNRVKAAASNHSKAAKNSRYSVLGMRKDEPITFSSDEVDDDGGNEVPYTIGRNAQRLASRNRNYAEMDPEIIEDDWESDDDVRIVEKEEELSDTPCLVCGKKDNLEMLLMCDDCDDCYHASCISPPSMVVPPDDWYCPSCNHERLLTAMRDKLTDLVKQLRKYQYKQNKKIRDQQLREKFQLRSSRRSTEDSNDPQPMGTNFGLSLDNILMEGRARSKRSHTAVRYTTEDYDKKFSEALKDAQVPKKTLRSEQKKKTYKEETDSDKTEASASQSDTDDDADDRKARKGKKKESRSRKGSRTGSYSGSDNSDLDFIRKEKNKRRGRSAKTGRMTRTGRQKVYDSETDDSDIENERTQKSKRNREHAKHSERNRKHQKSVSVNANEEESQSNSDEENSKIKGKRKKKDQETAKNKSDDTSGTEEEIDYKTRIQNLKKKGMKTSERGTVSDTDDNNDYNSKSNNSVKKDQESGSETDAENSEAQSSQIEVKSKKMNKGTRKVENIESSSDSDNEIRNSKVQKTKRKGHVVKKEKIYSSDSDTDNSDAEHSKDKRSKRKGRDVQHNEDSGSASDVKKKTKKANENKKHRNGKIVKKGSGSDTGKSETESEVKKSKLKNRGTRKNEATDSSSDTEDDIQETKSKKNEKKSEGSRKRQHSSRDKKYKKRKSKSKQPRLTLSGDEEAVSREAVDSDYSCTESTDSEDEEWDQMYVRKERKPPSSDENNKGPYITRSGRSTNSSSRIKKFLK